MLGEGRAKGVEERFKGLNKDFAEEAISVVFGRTWSRSGIDLKTRSLCSIALLSGLGRMNALKINFQLALANGATRNEIVEVLLQVAVYSGYPAALDALTEFEKVSEEPPRLGSTVKQFLEAVWGCNEDSSQESSHMSPR